jgi:hypothetical protein
MLLTSLGTWTLPSGDGDRLVMNVNFIDNVDDGNTNIDILGAGTPKQQTCFYNPALSPRMSMEFGSADNSWTHMDMNCSGAASLFHNEPDWNLGNQGQDGDNRSYSYPSSQPLWDAKQQPQKALPILTDDVLHEVESDSLARFPKLKVTRELPPLMPKSAPSFLGVVAGSDNTSVISQRPRKPGRRNGPLGAEGREGAFQMRHNRACVTCKLRKTKVSRGKQTL